MTSVPEVDCERLKDTACELVDTPAEVGGSVMELGEAELVDVGESSSSPRSSSSRATSSDKRMSTMVERSVYSSSFCSSDVCVTAGNAFLRNSISQEEAVEEWAEALRQKCIWGR